jgi:cytochrome c556
MREELMNKLALFALALWAMTAMAAGALFFRGRTTTAPDGRVAILLSQSERSVVLGEMRKMLIAVQQVAQGVAERDTAKVAAAATEASAHPQGAMPLGLMAKLPIDFKQSGMAMHDSFADVARAASDKTAEPAAVAAALAQTVARCVGCHETYRIDSER